MGALIALVICSLGLQIFAHEHHHHEHEDDEIARGKSKWFKQPEEVVHKHHEHDHGHHHHGHDHGHHHRHAHAHGHAHAHVHDHGHDHGHAHGHAHAHAHDHAHGHDHEHAHEHVHVHKPKPTKKPRKLTETIDMWWQAIVATLLISAAPFAILYVVPLESDAEKYQPLLKILLSFASGGLLGDAFLHLIPHAINPHTHDDEEGHDHHHHHHEEHDHSATTMVGMWVMAGVVAFLVIEKVIRLIQGGDGHCHHHGEEVAEPAAAAVEEEEAAVEEKSAEVNNKNEGSGESKEDAGDVGELRKRNVASNKATGDEAVDAVEEKEVEDEVEIKGIGEEVVEEKKMKVAGYLNLAADFAHNFTDGLAIGASFLSGQKLGFITTLTILFHEIPHEIGDFAILVQSGCDKKKAMWLQLSTATGAMAGCIIGLL